jgi:hypothetical protein
VEAGERERALSLFVKAATAEGTRRSFANAATAERSLVKA